MIPRYSRPEMVKIWEPENKFRIWFEIEAHACDAQANLGVIPKDAAEAVWKKGKWEISREKDEPSGLFWLDIEKIDTNWLITKDSTISLEINTAL